MDSLLKYFDHYIINARVAPAFFVVLPLALTVIAWIPASLHMAATILAVLVSFGVISFLSILISNQGNKLQDRLFQRWGGPPTNSLLRYSDNTLDPHTKLRYRECLQKQLPALNLPSEAGERENLSAADAVYASAVNYLREKTRNRQNYPMVYGDNVAYGFARNLLALRAVGVFTSIGSVLVNVVLLWAQWGDAGTTPMQAADFVPFAALIISLIMTVLFCVVVNENFVEGRAVRYAKSLLASCERMPDNAA